MQNSSMTDILYDYFASRILFGYYVLVNFAAAPELPRELERNFRNDESILRYMVVRQNG